MYCPLPGVLKERRGGGGGEVDGSGTFYSTCNKFCVKDTHMFTSSTIYISLFLLGRIDRSIQRAVVYEF